MKTLYLRAADENAMKDALADFALAEDSAGKESFITAGTGFMVLDEDAPIWVNEPFSLDVIGQIVLEDTLTDADGNIIKPPVYADGFHVNLLCGDQLAALIPQEIQIEVQNPKRKFA